MRKSFELLDPEEQKLFAWKVMRCFETSIPRNIKTISNIFTLIIASLDMPELEKEGEIPKMTQDQTIAALVTTVAISHLMQILYSCHAQMTNDKNIVDKLVKVFDEEQVSTENIPSTLLRISQHLCQEFLNGCEAN